MTEDSMVVSFEKTRQRLYVSCDGPTKISKPRRLDAMDYARDVPAGLINACQYSLRRRCGDYRRSYDQRPTRRCVRHRGMRPKVNAAGGRMRTRAAKVGAHTYHGMTGAAPRSRSC